jgi:hypothetical protein
VTTPSTLDPAPARTGSASWWFRSRDGHLTLFQFPNPALWVWIVAVVLGWFDLSPAHETAVTGVRHGALVVWAVDEVVRGSSPFRRVLGAVVLVAQVAMLALA